MAAGLACADPPEATDRPAGAAPSPVATDAPPAAAPGVDVASDGTMVQIDGGVIELGGRRGMPQLPPPGPRPGAAPGAQGAPHGVEDQHPHGGECQRRDAARALGDQSMRASSARHSRPAGAPRVGIRGTLWHNAAFDGQLADRVSLVQSTPGPGPEEFRCRRFASYT